jgi:hypothetical protein
LVKEFDDANVGWSCSDSTGSCLNGCLDISRWHLNVSSGLALAESQSLSARWRL